MLIQQRHLIWLILLIAALFHAPAQASRCWCARNLGVSDGLIGGLDDFAGFNLCFSGAGVVAPESCLRSTFEGGTPATGSFTLHGRPVDVLADGKVLTFVRARYYDAENARWLQRDPKGNIDGPNLYESFRSNAVNNLDPMGTEVWAEARRVKTTLNGVPVWRVDYTFNKDGVSLGFGGLLVPSAVESTQAGTEFFRFTDDPRKIKRIEAQVESLRQIIEAGQIADIQIASLEQGIKTSATIAVALPVAAVAAPAATAVFGTSVTGATVAGATTGAVSFGSGGATGEALIGGSLEDIAIAGGKDAALGAVTFGVFGGGARLLAGESTIVESFDTALLRSQASQLSEAGPFVRFIRQGEFNAIQRAIAQNQPTVRIGRFFTTDAITTGRSAANQLALPNVIDDPIVGFVRVQGAGLQGTPFAGPRIVRPDFGQLGFGTEVEFFVSPTVRRTAVELIGLR